MKLFIGNSAANAQGKVSQIWQSLTGVYSSNSDLSINTIVRDTGNVSGIINTFEKVTPVIASAVAVDDQFHTFSSPIKKVVLQVLQNGTTEAAFGFEVYVVFGALDLADAIAKLGNAGERQIVKFNDFGEFPFPDVGGSYNIAYAINTGTGAAAVKVALEVQL